MTDLVHIPFRGEEILAVEIEGQPWVIFRHAVESIGLDYASQYRKIMSRTWANRCSVTTVATDGSLREMTAVDVPTLLAWLATVNDARVAASVRDKLVAYQAESVAAIHSYWTKGSANNPRWATPEPDTLTWGETAAMLRQRYGLTYTAVGLTRRLRTAGVLKQNATEPTANFRYWFWFTGSTFHVLPHILAEMANVLGKTEHQLQQFAGVQMRLELDGVGQAALTPDLSAREGAP